MITRALGLMLSTILRFFWQRAEEYYQQQQRENEIRRRASEEVESFIEEHRKANHAIDLTPDSVTEAFDRLRTLAKYREDVDYSGYADSGELSDADGERGLARVNAIPAEQNPFVSGRSDSTPVPAPEPEDSGQAEGDE